MMKIIYYLLIFIFVTYGRTYSNAKILSDRYLKPVIKNFSPLDYMGHGQVWDMVQAKNGIIYFANTYTGILEYDGTYWKRIPLKKSQTARCLEIDANGTVYAGGKGDFGFLKRNNERTEFVSLVENIPDDVQKFGNVWQILTSDNGIYFIAYKYIFRWFQNRIEVIEAQSEFYPGGKVNNELYVLQNRTGLMLIKDSSLIPAQDGLRFRQEKIIANVFLPYDTNNMIVTGKDDGCHIYDGKKLKRFHTQADKYLKKNLVYNGTVLSGGLFAFGTKKGGIIIIDKQGHVKGVIDKKHGLRDNHVLSLFMDSQNGLWLGLNNGISHIDFFSPFSSFDESSGYRGSVLSILRHNEKLYVGTSLGLYEENLNINTGAKLFKRVSGINGQVKKLIIADDSLLAGTLFGVFLIANGRVVDRISHDTVFDMIKSEKNGDIIYAAVTGKGLFAIEKRFGTWTLKGEINGINDNIVSFSEDNDGSFWMASEDGKIINAYYNTADNSFEKIKCYDKQSFGSNIRISRISNRFLFCTERGIFKFNSDRNTFEPDTSIGIFFQDRDIMDLTEDASGNVWIRESIIYKVYFSRKRTDGSYELNAPFFGSQRFRCYTIYNDIQGLIWFGGPEGLILYQSKMDRKPSQAYRPLISRVEVKGRTVFGDGNNNTDFPDIEDDITSLEYKNNSLHFYFSAPYYYDESMNQYRVKLNNFDKDWSGWSNRTDTFYSGLPYGSYEFLVQARNYNGHISGTGKYSFIINPPWYRTWWSYIFYFVVCLLLYRVWIILKAYLNIYKENLFKKEIDRQIKDGTYKNTIDNRVKVINYFAEQKNLTRREEEVLSHIIEGRSTNDIAKLLYISPLTAKKHIQNLFEKTDTHSRIELFKEFNNYIENAL